MYLDIKDFRISRMLAGELGVKEKDIFKFNSK